MSKHTETLQNSLKTLKNSKEQVSKLRVIKSHEFASKTLSYPPTLKSNIVLNVSSIYSHQKQANNKRQINMTNMAK